MRHMGVSADRLLYVEVNPLYIKSFSLNDKSGHWTLEHSNTWINGGNAKVMPLIAAIDPLNTEARACAGRLIDGDMLPTSHGG